MLSHDAQLRETIGAESRDVTRYKAKLEERARQEEELFIRAPVTKLDKKMEKHLRKSRNGYAASHACVNDTYRRLSSIYRYCGHGFSMLVLPL